MEQNTFTLFWRDGLREIVQGKTIAQAMTHAGYGQGALRALDFHAEGDCQSWVWDASARDWRQRDASKDRPES